MPDMFWSDTCHQLDEAGVDALVEHDAQADAAKLRANHPCGFERPEVRRKENAWAAEIDDTLHLICADETHRFGVGAIGEQIEPIGRDLRKV